MRHMTFTRSLLLACALVPACGDDKADDTTSATEIGNTPATPATPATEPDPTVDLPTMASMPTDPSGDPSTDPSGDPSTDPTNDPTAGGGQFCQEECSVDGDCTLSGMDLGFKCTDGRCTTEGCADNNACVLQYSGWITDCTEQAGCPGQVCIDVGGGVGKCATPPSEFLMCDVLMQAEAMYPTIEGDMDVTVCAQLDYECKDGACINPCTADADCPNAPYTKCDTASGQCQCSDDAACMASNADTPVCGSNGFCGCAEDANCKTNGDVCNDGACGCSDVSVCTTKAFDGTNSVCEGI